MGVSCKADDDYRYQEIDFLLEIIDRPFNEWETKKYKILDSHEKFKTGRNDKCSCRSGVKYKNCCLKKAGIEIEHTDFILKRPTFKSSNKTKTTRLLPDGTRRRIASK